MRLHFKKAQQVKFSCQNKWFEKPKVYVSAYKQAASCNSKPKQCKCTIRFKGTLSRSDDGLSHYVESKGDQDFRNDSGKNSSPKALILAVPLAILVAVKVCF